jgi:hypothetical protein
LFTRGEVFYLHTSLVKNQATAKIRAKYLQRWKPAKVKIEDEYTYSGGEGGEDGCGKYL